MRITDKDLRICLMAYALTGVSLAWGHTSGPEFIESFDTMLEIRESGRMDIRHVIDVHPHGDEIRRGVFFELPDNLGPLEGFSATLNGKVIEPERDSGDLIVAAAEPLEIHASHRFEVEYRAPVPLEQSAKDTVMLQWRPIIDRFELAWRESKVTLAWPEGRMPTRLPANGEHAGGAWRILYRGSVADGATQSDIDALDVRWSADAWPDGAVRREAAHWARRAAMVAAIVLLFSVLHGMWRAVGRDPDIGRVAARREPPQGISPAAGRYIEQMGFDQKAFVAALVSLRVKGRITMEIDAEDQRLRLEQAVSADRKNNLSPGERAVEKKLFADGSRVELAPGSKAGVRAMKALSKTLGREHRGRHFVTNNRQRSIGFGLGVGVVAGGIALLIAELGAVMERDPVAIVLGFVAVVAGVLLPGIYFELLKAPTRAGATVRREIAALKRHLEDSSPCHDSPRHFVELLPWAIALDAEESWRARFGERLDAERDAEIADIVRWYRQLVQDFDSIGAVVPLIAASAGATAASSASAGGASAGGV